MFGLLHARVDERRLAAAKGERAVHGQRVCDAEDNLGCVVREFAAIFLVHQSWLVLRPNLCVLACGAVRTMLHGMVFGI